ncbi:hypothetical protein ACFPRL_20505 [Pseudoclavibacter helvolus]
MDHGRALRARHRRPGAHAPRAGRHQSARQRSADAPLTPARELVPMFAACIRRSGEAQEELLQLIDSELLGG